MSDKRMRALFALLVGYGAFLFAVAMVIVVVCLLAHADANNWVMGFCAWITATIIGWPAAKIVNVLVTV